MARRGAGGRRGREGMTLLELLVAFAIFVLMLAALVTLGRAGLDTWQQGETRKDVYDRARRVIDRIAEDLRNTWSDDRWYRGPNGEEMQHASFAGDLDENKVARLRFVRSGTIDEMRTSTDMVTRPPATEFHYTDLWEVAYVMDRDPKKPVLHRLVRYFNRRTTESVLNAEDISQQGSRFWNQVAQPIDDGVLWIQFKYWSQYTTTWYERSCWTCPNAQHAAQQQYAREGKCGVLNGDRPCGRDLREGTVGPLERVARASNKLVGPSMVWDSSRTGIRGWLFSKRMELENPDFIYPEIVQLTIVVESTASELRGGRLAGDLDSSGTSMTLTNATALPDGPAHVKIGAEWIQYEAKTSSQLLRLRRGQRGSKAESHAAGDPVRYGETFVTDIPIPAFREAAR